jgi:glycosyltransferase involved in cell wall biosynthesis
LIPLVVTAKNEEKSIKQCVESIIRSVDSIERRHSYQFDIVIILDDCIDQTEYIVECFSRVRILKSTGGIVAAQRLASETIIADFIIFSDADIYIEEEALLSIVKAMTENNYLRIAYPIKRPLAPLAPTLLAKAIFTYNQHNGFQTKRHYFNGMLFAIREWSIPSLDSLRPRIRQLPTCRFYCFEEGIRTDDMYLSRRILEECGRAAIQEVSPGVIFYRPSETYTGMYRTYRRMRMEIERLNKLVPSSQSTYKRDGVRKYDRKSLVNANVSDKFYWYVFRLVLQVCKANYIVERIWYKYFSTRNCPAWQIIEESKSPIYKE